MADCIFNIIVQATLAEKSVRLFWRDYQLLVPYTTCLRYKYSENRFSMNFVGCLVSLNCGDVLGTYQGQVKKIDNSSQALTIVHPFRNGIKCEVPEITISAIDIKELRIVKSADEANRVLPKNVTPSKLSKETAEDLDHVASPGRIVEPKGDHSKQSEQKGDNYKQSVNGQKVNGHGGQQRDKHAGSRYECNVSNKDRLGYEDSLNSYTCKSPNRHTPTRDRDANGISHRNNGYRYDDNMGRIARLTPTKDEETRIRRNSASGPEARGCAKSSVPRKIEFRKKSQQRQDCFSAPVDSILDDFDFEKNLALFDKKAVFEEIENCNPEVIKIADKKPAKYRCDENVLQSGPVILQQIKVPNQSDKAFVTDSGLVVPCIDYDLRNKLFDVAEACGYTVERRLEMVGRSSSEMILQLLGGSSRLNPQNGHQLPTVVVLCGPHIQGAQGLNCARHLVNHGVKTCVFLPNFLRMIACVEQELKMYEMCNGKRYSAVQDIPSSSIDMIVNCMDSHENSFLRDQAWYQAHVKWVGQCRAPVFTIDPPIESVDIVPKWCLYPVLPLAAMDMPAQLYLCDLGLPRKVFKDVGITYRSPFSHKFIVPLHPRS